jgi:hypothetical protein
LGKRDFVRGTVQIQETGPRNEPLGHWGPVKRNKGTLSE